MPKHNPPEDYDPVRKHEFNCWSCGKYFKSGEGVTIDDSGIEQCCDECWGLVPVTSRLVLGLLFRHIDAGGVGLTDLFEQAIEKFPPLRKMRGQLDSDN